MSPPGAKPRLVEQPCLSDQPVSDVMGHPLPVQVEDPGSPTASDVR